MTNVTTFASEGLLTVREVAEAMRVSTMTVYRLIHAEELPAIRVGSNLRIRRADLAAYLNARVVGGHNGTSEGSGTWPAA